MEKRTEAPYSTNDLILLLDIGGSTLRKWCISLEEHDYTFYRTDQNKRLFTDQDIIVLKHFSQLVKEKNMSMNNAALVVTSKFKKSHLFSVETEIEQSETNVIPFPDQPSNDVMVQDLLERMKLMEQQQTKLIEMNQELIKRLNEQHQYIKDSLEQRDRKLMESIRESQEERKALLQLATAQEEKKKGFWSKLFGN